MIPLWIVYMATRAAGILFYSKRGLLHSYYDKLASDLVFDNLRMVEKGFKQSHSLETVFLAES